MEMPYGGIKHFPAGTYDEQMKNLTGRVEMQLMNTAHSAWYAFKHLAMSEWGENERRLAKWMMPVEKVEPPTRRLDSLVWRLWPFSWWLNAVVRDMRGLDNG
jgi:hypothetical protein